MTYLLIPGAGVWPRDELHDCSPCTPLRFDPPLPAR